MHTFSLVYRIFLSFDPLAESNFLWFELNLPTSAFLTLISLFQLIHFVPTVAESMATVSRFTRDIKNLLRGLQGEEKFRAEPALDAVIKQSGLPPIEAKEVMSLFAALALLFSKRLPPKLQESLVASNLMKPEGAGLVPPSIPDLQQPLMYSSHPLPLLSPLSTLLLFVLLYFLLASPCSSSFRSSPLLSSSSL